MPAHPVDDQTRLALSERLADLSYRLSRAAPSIKPFLRFPRDSSFLAETKRFWDFDYLVQVELLRMRRRLISPDEIVRSDMVQWAKNLMPLYHSVRSQLDAVKQGADTANPHFGDFAFNDRAQFIVDRLGAGARLLYVGAGTGRECMQFAARGLRVVGIDILVNLLAIGREWAEWLERDVYLAGMDLLAIGCASNRFDGVLLEFYGSLPAWSQRMRAQRELARVLSPDGRGFIVGSRKHYASHWYRMRQIYPEPMRAFLLPQSALDFYYAKRDEAVELQKYGFYTQAHTPESLEHELGAYFEVLALHQFEDPRYIVAEVQPKHDIDFSTPIPADGADVVPVVTAADVAEITDWLARVAQLMAELETHQQRLIEYFQDGKAGRDCLKTVDVNLAGMLSLLAQIVPNN